MSINIDNSNELLNLINNNSTIDTTNINITDQLNISKLNIGNLEINASINGNINIANMFNFDTNNFSSTNITTDNLTVNKNIIINGYND